MFLTIWEVKPFKQFHTIILKSMNQIIGQKYKNTKSTQVYQPIRIRTSISQSTQQYYIYKCKGKL